MSYFTDPISESPEPSEHELYPHDCDVCGQPAMYAVKENYDYVCRRESCQAIYTMTYRQSMIDEGDEPKDPTFKEVPIN